ncbi:MFS phospholipid transporter-like protein Git1 [Coleophoma crateriformis]|uniref:MFS phospholipid transporter-like protein Git1 n=1 Tax=Coleophoma crateriformis TaxID=565419 RepID=A0A3D8SHI4_9HELO|nr:MFS phospholipid transporter-like protein Git1 [Coleophoma crateriformis]
MFGRERDTEEHAPIATEVDLAHTGKSFWERVWPVFACGAGLFSDGYVNNVIGSVSTMLGSTKLYGTAYSGSKAQQNIGAITFAGTVLGQLVFGYTSDKWSRKNSLLISTIILIVFTALGAGAYGAGGNIQGMFAALTAYRFLVGIGIGGEYPAGSVACSEASGEMKSGTRNRWFVLFTNVMIDWGFVVGAFVPYLMVVICTENHLRAAWRISLGLGVVFPLSLLWLRIKLKEPEEFARESMKYVQIPYRLVIRFYGLRLLAVSAIWFLYDFSVYSFSIYSSAILANIYPSDAPLTTIFGWNTVINLFYIPGAILGSFWSDAIGPRYALASGVFAQGIVGFIQAGLYETLAKPENVAGFCVVYGIFLSLGELGPGDNIGLCASKSCATGVRGQYYAIAAAMGKIGAFVGTYIFPIIEKAGGSNTVATAQYPFYVSSSFCILMTFIAIFCIPNIGQDTITHEDIRFREYLEANGWDTNQLGLMKDETYPGRPTMDGPGTETVASGEKTSL